MSRIGKKPILIPEGVEINIEAQKVVIKGPKGELVREIRPEVKIEIKDNQIFVLSRTKASKQQKSANKQTKKIKAFWGLTRALLSNMVEGVVTGYEKKLEIKGVGFRAEVEGEELVLQLGFTHPVKVKISKDIKFSVEKNIITISGIDKELVGQTAARIRRTKPPEPYKGKGIRYLGEVVRRKVGKKVITAGV